MSRMARVLAVRTATTHLCRSIQRHPREQCPNSYANPPNMYRVTVDTRQHCTDNAKGEWPSNPSIRTTLRRCPVGKLSANCWRTATMTRYTKGRFPYQWSRAPRCGPGQGVGRVHTGCLGSLGRRGDEEMVASAAMLS